jgi:hypothetical protein
MKHAIIHVLFYVPGMKGSNPSSLTHPNLASEIGVEKKNLGLVSSAWAWLELGSARMKNKPSPSLLFSSLLK